MTTPPGAAARPGGAPPIVDAVRSQLGRARAVARRSRRFSWLAWGSLFAMYGGLAVFVVLGLHFSTVVTTTLPGGGTSTSTVLPLWVYPVGATPPAVVFALAIRELFVARRESRGPPPPSPPGEESDSPGWTVQAVESQKLLERAKGETEMSFLPLAFGFLGAGGLAGTLVGARLLTASSSGAAVAVLPPTVGALLAVGLLWPLYAYARDWIGDCQKELEREVREVARLEAEFLWRFAGTPG